MKTIKTDEELNQALKIQRSALAASAKAYDAGETWEALRLATSVWILVHDSGRNNRSILGALGLKKKLQFLSTAYPCPPNNMIDWHPLVGFSIGSKGVKPQPFLENTSKPSYEVKFSSWWEKENIYLSGDKKRRLSRKNLIFNLRSRDGGAHYDPDRVDPNFSSLKSGAGWTVNTNGASQTIGGTSEQGTPLRELELGTMRQIAWEVMETLDRAGI